MSFFNNKLRIRPATMAHVVSDWKDISGSYALVYMPFVEYMPNLNTVIFLGARFIWGKGNSAFAMLEDKDKAVIRISFKF